MPLVQVLLENSKLSFQKVKRENSIDNLQTDNLNAHIRDKKTIPVEPDKNLNQE